MASLTTLASTYFKASTQQSGDLTTSEKVQVPAGKTLNVDSASVEAGHYHVHLTAPLPPVGDDGYFYAGHVHIEGLAVSAQPRIVQASHETDGWFATVDQGPRFLVGKETSYEGNRGLYNYGLEAGRYSAQDYSEEFGFWAYFIGPTVQCESTGSFTCLNTYDRARFTFGFLQFAAHVPGGDFIKFLCALLELPSASGYFPDLYRDGETILRRTGGTPKTLASSVSTAGLQDYLNPSLDQVEMQEVIQAAKFVHWATISPEHRRLQVSTGIRFFQDQMQWYGRRYPIDGAPAKVCMVIADIHHQGRGRTTDVMAALNTGGNYQRAYDNLLKIGSRNYGERIATLEKRIEHLENQGILGTRVYRASSNDFH